MENLRNPRVLGTQYRVYDKDGKYKRTIDKTDEKNLDESDWLKGVTCFVINEKGEVLIEVRANKGLTPGKIFLELSKPRGTPCCVTFTTFIDSSRFIPSSSFNSLTIA